MAQKLYDWDTGVELLRHTEQKHIVLREYFRAYLRTRCKLPKREKFRLAVVDAFAGGGLYKNGEFGSPLIFIDVLRQTAIEINLERATGGMKPLLIECLLILNDDNKDAYRHFMANVAPHLLKTEEIKDHLQITLVDRNQNFEKLYPEIKEMLLANKITNVFFNLDQCGYAQVPAPIIRDIMTSWRSAEIILTFAIDSLLTYLSPEKEKSGVPLAPEVREKVDAILENGDKLYNKQEWLGEAEKIVFSYLKDCASFVSPFSINNPDGWQYWLMHFATNYRARQVYNDVLHAQDATQAHFGRAGLNMLSYDPSVEGQTYLFDFDSRKRSIEDLQDDIPRMVSRFGDAISLLEFYGQAYSETPAHSDDIHETIISNPDLEVVTEMGGKRRAAGQIQPSDTLVLRSQKSFSFTFKT